jgi:hypothetical protein
MVWFLVAKKQGTWQSAGGCSDPGYRPITYRDDMRTFLRQRKEKQGR